MAITLKTKVTINMSIVVDTKTVEQLQHERAEARNLAAAKVAELNGQARAFHSLYVSEKTDEEVLEVVLRHGFREGMTETVKSEMGANSEFRAKGVQVAVTYKSARKCTCSDTANAGCSDCQK